MADQACLGANGPSLRATELGMPEALFLSNHAQFSQPIVKVAFITETHTFS